MYSDKLITISSERGERRPFLLQGHRFLTKREEPREDERNKNQLNLDGKCFNDGGGTYQGSF